MKIELDGLSAGYGAHWVLEEINLGFEEHSITAVIGPSGSGKSTLLRIVNRLHEEYPGANLRGKVRLDGTDVYGPGVDPASIRRRVGFIAQSPSLFPTSSIFENAIAGLRFNGVRRRSELEARGESVLHLVGLWEDVADRLHKPAHSLSTGQQQLLCIARALAVEPEVLLMDEPTSALDPVTTLLVERMLKRLREEFTIVVVTHDLQQAARLSDFTALLSSERAGGPGRVIEAATTVRLFTEPEHERAEAYLSGRIS